MVVHFFLRHFVGPIAEEVCRALSELINVVRPWNIDDTKG